MTLPDRCDMCGAFFDHVWDDSEDTPCSNCQWIAVTWEHLSPEDRRLRTRLIAKREAIETARNVSVNGGVL